MIRKLSALFARPTIISAVQAHAALTDDRAVLLDVRERAEWQAGHAPQARHVVLSQLEERLRDLPADRPIITCRSAIAVKVLTQHGYQATNLTGGMHAWAAAGLPVTAHGGATGQII